MNIGDRVMFLGLGGDSGQVYARVCFGMLGTVTECAFAGRAYVLWDEGPEWPIFMYQHEIKLAVPESLPPNPTIYEDQGSGPYRARPVPVPEPEPEPEPMLALPWRRSEIIAEYTRDTRLGLSRLGADRGRTSQGGHAWFWDPASYYMSVHMETVWVGDLQLVRRPNGRYVDSRCLELRIERIATRVRDERRRGLGVHVVDRRWRQAPNAELRISPDGTCSFWSDTWQRAESWDGFDLEGYDRSGFDRGGRDRQGYDRNGFDVDGYDLAGWHREGQHRDGRHRNYCSCPECDIQSYHSQDRDWPIQDDRILFGVENEIECEDREARRRVVKYLPKRSQTELYLIAERDGSLEQAGYGTAGVEFIGPPLPLEFYSASHPDVTRNPWTGFLPAIRDACGAYAPPDGYGMHINVSRDPIKRWDASKGTRWERRFLDTMNNCKALVEFVAGRPANEWADWADGDERYAVYPDADKYRVCNVQNHVIELRIFRASTDPARMRANVQFVHAVLMWTKAGKRGRNNLDAVRILDWVRARAPKYPDLIPVLSNFEV